MTGIIRKEKPHSIVSDSGGSGVDISYVKCRQEVWIGGWYDGMVGIESVKLTLDDLEWLGIPIRRKK